MSRLRFFSLDWPPPGKPGPNQFHPGQTHCRNLGRGGTPIWPTASPAVALGVLSRASGADELGPDGHPALGGFLPPAHNRNRMWAGSRIEFYHR